MLKTILILIILGGSLLLLSGCGLWWPRHGYGHGHHHYSSHSSYHGQHNNFKKLRN